MKLDREKVISILSQRERIVLEKEGYTRAAVLLPLFHREGRVFLVFTHRTDTVSTHKGEISFPGGVIDSGDRDPVMAALREAQEEVEVEPEEVSIAGMLDDITTVTHYLISPVVGFLRKPRRFRPNPQEIRRILEIPVESFFDPEVFRVDTRYEFEGRRYPIYYFHLPVATVWGATARIMKQFLELCCGWVPPRQGNPGHD